MGCFVGIYGGAVGRRIWVDTGALEIIKVVSVGVRSQKVISWVFPESRGLKIGAGSQKVISLVWRVSVGFFSELRGLTVRTSLCFFVKKRWCFSVIFTATFIYLKK